MCSLEKYREMLFQTPLNCRYQKIHVKTVVKKNRRKTLPETLVNLRYQKNCIEMLVLLVPDKIVVQNFARTSTPKKTASKCFSEK